MHPCEQRPDWTGLVELRTDLERFLSVRCRDPHEVDDAVQESLVRAARFRAGQRHPERLRPWLLRIGANVLADRAHRNRRYTWWGSGEMELEDVPGGAAPEDVIDEHEVWCGRRLVGLARARVVLERALAQLPQPDRVALGGLYFDGLRRVEVARRLGVSTALVKVRLFRAKQRLRRAFERELEVAA